MSGSVLGMILAGGEGKRLSPLTTQRAKPAVPFGGKYRIVDFVLSNFVNSGIESIFVLTQFKSQSLIEHIINGWMVTSSHAKGRFIIPVPAQMQTEDKTWYVGTADAIYQNMHLIDDFDPQYVAVFGGDHIYRMDISQMVDFHTRKDALCSVAAIPVPVEEATQFGVIQVDSDWRIIGFQEKPENPSHIPGNPSMALASMGNYVFSKDILMRLLLEDAKNPESHHDFGKNILPSIVDTGKLFAYNFCDDRIVKDYGMKPYWRDVGTLKSYYDANMDLRTVAPELNLYDPKWPIYNYQLSLPPAKFVHNQEVGPSGMQRIGKAIDSLVCDGCIVSGSTVVNSVLFNSVIVHSYSTVLNSIILNEAEIGEYSKVNNCIIDKHVKLPAHSVVGYDRAQDEARFHVEDMDPELGTWLTVIAKPTEGKSKRRRLAMSIGSEIVG